MKKAKVIQSTDSHADVAAETTKEKQNTVEHIFSANWAAPEIVPRKLWWYISFCVNDLDYAFYIFSSRLGTTGLYVYSLAGVNNYVLKSTNKSGLSAGLRYNHDQQSGSEVRQLLCLYNRDNKNKQDRHSKSCVIIA